MYEKIPNELKKLTQWGCFHREWVEARGKYTKIPIDPWTGGPGKSNDQSTWSDFDTALRALDKYPNADGLAFYFANGYVGLDIDHVADELEKVAAGDSDPENFINKAQELTKDTYMEISMSGEGIHAIFKGKLPGKRRRKGNFEIYQSGRFFALTGHVVHDEREIQSLNDDEMQRLYDHYFQGDKVVEFPERQQPLTLTNNLSDDEVIQRAERSSNGQRFRFFMEGGWEPFYNSQSEADLAFANDLAFWTGRDFAQMDRIFRISNLMRSKYDEKHGQTTYGIGLLNKAIAETQNVFSPREKPTFNYDLSFLNKHKEKPKQPRSWDDMGNAQRFLDNFGKIVKYSYIDKTWFVYNGSYWEQDKRGQVEQLGDLTIMAMEDEKVKIPPEVKDDEKDYLKKWEQFKKKSRSNKSKKNMLDEVQHHVAVQHGDFDKEQMLLNTVSGYVDLSSGVLHDHDREKMFSRQAEAEYTESIDAPEWEAFLQETFEGNEELIHYIHKAVGYSATGSTKEQVMFILYGNGRNGKSIFINTIADVLGSYAKQMNAETIMVKRSSSGAANSDVARLEGARMVISSESDEGSRLNESLVKQMSGGDRMVARHLYGKEFEFEPQFKLWMATNHKPLIRGTDDGIWRRLILIPFKHQVAKEDVDKDLKYKLERESAGILNWIVQGALLWQREGLEPPQAVSAERDEYRTEMDVLELFVAENCEVGTNYTAPAGDLFNKYKEWALESNEYLMSKQKFSREMKKKYRYKRLSHGRFFYGLKISSDQRLNFNGL